MKHRLDGRRNDRYTYAESSMQYYHVAARRSAFAIASWNFRESCFIAATSTARGSCQYLQMQG
jgi:hypothetical protein